ncbi:MAG: TetR/AcrR family transcriptional regulator [Chloroflexaceae bacterium]|jgi:AcrR family transcriptional regulator|nr:TetR/AcrR family transcriptional regulator [Chloroflexaceae bacterium]
MAKGEWTRQLIVMRAADVFNVRGYAGTSMNDLIEATGMEKGGIYNHFASKEELALAAFDYAVDLMTQRFELALSGKEHAVERLRAIVDVFQDYVTAPPLPGGCPILNTAVEFDDTSPVFREKAREAMLSWLKLIGVHVKLGVQRGELRPDADPRTVASMLTATLEGALMLSKLYDDPSHMARAIAHMHWYIGMLATEGTENTEGIGDCS